MNNELQNKWMEGQLVALVRRAAENDVGAYVIYGQLLAASVGVGGELEPELREEVHESLRAELGDEVVDLMEDIHDAKD